MDILIADDHNVVISGLIRALECAFDNASFSLAHDAVEVFHLLDQKKDYDLALVDLKMPGMHGFEFLQKLCGQFPSLKVAVISGIDDSNSIKQAIALGAGGFIPKSVSEETLINAIRLVLRGDIYLPTHILNERPVSESVGPMEDVSIDFKQDYQLLTERQKEIMLLLGDALSNKEIARQLALSENTIKVHVSSILRVLKLRNRTQAGVIGEKLKQAGSPWVPDNNE